ncbi:MAG: catalase-related domain-containing protein [Candidatus Binatia bacterium]
MSDDQKWRWIQNIVGAMKTMPKKIQSQIRRFYKADPAYGEGVAHDWICWICS